MPESDSDNRNRDDEMKPTAPPRSATEPTGSKGKSDTPKTMTDPATGEPNHAPPRSNKEG